MKKFIALCVLLAIAVVVIAQQDSVAVEDLEDPVIPDWISYAVNALLAAIAVWLSRAKLRLGKAVVLLQGLSDALADGTVSKAEVSSLIRQARELVAKEK